MQHFSIAHDQAQMLPLLREAEALNPRPASGGCEDIRTICDVRISSHGRGGDSGAQDGRGAQAA
jgi:hypothetical protein